MKGFYIYEEEFVKGTVDCLEIGYINHTFSHRFGSGTLSEEVEMDAHVLKGTKTKCSPDDTYDFETGALIALMKMCGVEKVVRACNEAFSEDTFKTYATKYERELNTLKKDFDKVRDLKDFYKKNYEDVKEHYDKLGDRNKYLIDDINKKLEYIKEKDEEIKKLKSDKDKSWKNYQRKIQKKQDRINELERAYKASNDDEAKLVEYYQREIKKFEEENKELKGNIDELFESEQHSKSELGRLYFEKHRLEEEVEKLKDEVRLKKDAINEWKQTLRRTNEKIGDLVCENEKLKLDCEKLQYGYNDTDMIFCGGRQNGKQYTFLVDLFKKIPKDKVQAAYKKAYGDRVIWCTSQPEVHPLSTAVLEGVSYLNKKFKTYSIEEWLYKPPTKREEMWEKIFTLHKESDVIIKVKKEDVITFLHEIENKIPEITWASCVKIFETKYTIKDIFKELEGCDTPYEICFRLWKVNKLSYSSDQYIYPSYKFKHIDYLPPMRWDLFKKGRLAVKVNYGNYKEFYESCERELGKKPSTVYPEEYTVSICKKDGLFEIFTIEDQKSTGRKIVDWEDVR